MIQAWFKLDPGLTQTWYNLSLLCGFLWEILDTILTTFALMWVNIYESLRDSPLTLDAVKGRWFCFAFEALLASLRIRSACGWMTELKARINEYVNGSKFFSLMTVRGKLSFFFLLLYLTARWDSKIWGLMRMRLAWTWSVHSARQANSSELN